MIKMEFESTKSITDRYSHKNYLENLMMIRSEMESRKEVSISIDSEITYLLMRN
jgi:hypothetical protein